jgi:ferredoxin-type protein NapH
MRLARARFLSQAISFAVLNLGFKTAFKTGIVCPVIYCYSCPLSAFACPIGTLQRFIIMSTVPYYSLGQISLYSLGFGRAYCGWVCPFGTFQDIVSRIGSRFNRKVRRVPPLKFGALALIMISAYLFADTYFCRLCPSASLFASLPFSWLNPQIPLGFFFEVHLLTLLVIIVGAVFVRRFWCRYLCPVGAITGVFNRLSALGVDVDAGCESCGLCLKKCPMGIDKVSDIGSSTDCIRCGICVEACPNKNIKFHP